MLSRIQIGKLLLLMLVFLCAVQLTTSGVAFSLFRGTMGDVGRLNRLAVDKAEHANEMTVRLMDSRINLSRYMTRVLRTNEPKPEILEHVLKQLAAADAAKEKYASVGSEPGEEQQLDQAFLDQFKVYRGALNELVGFLQAGNVQQFLDQPTQKYQDSYIAARDAAALHARETGKAAWRDAQQRFELFSVLAGVFAIGSIALALGFRAMSSRLIVHPILRIVHAVERSAAGDLTAEISVDSSNEIGRLAAAVEKMQGGLANIVGSVRLSSDSIATASSEIAAGNADLSQRTESQASALAETAASMDEFAATVSANADNAKRANELAVEADALASRGGEAMKAVVVAMKGISQSSSEIGEIIGTIDSIAFQTNILALNAAVEAARAGEQGRGFAVVAGEVRTLAQRSAEAAKQIKTLVSTSIERVSAGTAQVDSAGETMGEVVQSIRRVTAIVGEISTASSEQSAGVSQIGQAVSQMDESTQRNAALVEESAAAAASLRGQAQELVTTVAQFRLK